MRLANIHIIEVVKGASLSFIVKISAAFTSLLFYIYLGRTLGAELSGVFFLLLTILTIASVVVRFGLDNTLLMLIAKNESDGNWSFIISAYLKSVTIVLLLSSMVSTFTFLCSESISIWIFSSESYTIHIEFVALAIPPLALSVIHAHALQGLKMVFASTLILNMLVPFTALLVSILVGEKYGLIGFIVAYTIAAYSTVIVSIFFWWTKVGAFSLVGRGCSWTRLIEQSMPLFWVAIMQMLINWLSYLVLGAYANDSDVGIFGVAIRIATLFGFFLMAVNTISAPKIANLQARKETEQVEMLCRSSSTLLLLVTLPIFVIVFINSEYFLLLFGEDFVDGSSVLKILLLGQFVNLACGSVGVLLIMSGCEQVMRDSLFWVVLICVVLNFALVPLFGILGAAISFSLTMAFQNMLFVFKAREILKVNVLPYINPLRMIKND